MLDPNELIEEYRKHYDVSEYEAITLVLEDIKHTTSALKSKMALLEKGGEKNVG